MKAIKTRPLATSSVMALTTNAIRDALRLELPWFHCRSQEQLALKQSQEAGNE